MSRFLWFFFICLFMYGNSYAQEGNGLKKTIPPGRDTIKTLPEKKIRKTNISDHEIPASRTANIDERGNLVIPPDIEPSFPGGKNALDSFLKKYLIYPVEAAKMKAEGIVVVTFSVEVDGSVNSPTIVLDKVGHGAAEEVKRLVSLMPRWKPAYKDGLAMPVYYSLPVKFKL